VKIELLLSIVCLPAVAACASMQTNNTVCPEFRSLRCATAPECSMDQNRDCQVCQCSSPSAPLGGSLPNGLPPDQRPPR
jgi:hypothetical protein